MKHIKVFKHYYLLYEHRLGENNSLQPRFVFQDEDNNTPEKGKVYKEQTSHCKWTQNCRKDRGDSRLKELLSNLPLSNTGVSSASPRVKCPQTPLLLDPCSSPIFWIPLNGTTIPTNHHFCSKLKTQEPSWIPYFPSSCTSKSSPGSFSSACKMHCECTPVHFHHCRVVLCHRTLSPKPPLSIRLHPQELSQFSGEPTWAPLILAWPAWGWARHMKTT